RRRRQLRGRLYDGRDPDQRHDLLDHADRGLGGAALLRGLQSADARAAWRTRQGADGGVPDRGVGRHGPAPPRAGAAARGHTALDRVTGPGPLYRDGEAGPDGGGDPRPVPASPIGSDGSAASTMEET